MTAGEVPMASAAAVEVRGMIGLASPRERVLSLFAEYGPALYRFTLVLVRHHQDAEDAVQETFLKLLRHLEAGRAETNLRGWLFTVAAHAGRDRLRSRRRWIPW